jgi:hypothetical protein
LDDDEEIEVVTLSFEQMDAKIMSGEIWCVQTVAAWQLAKDKLPGILTGV